MKRLLCFFMLFLLFTAGCFQTTGDTAVHSIEDYRSIPNITQEEIEQIEALKASRDSFTYGVLIGTELYSLPDGTTAGFAKEYAKLLTDLFGIPFHSKLYLEWDEVQQKTADFEIDFHAELVPTPERMERYYMTLPIIEHGLRVFTHNKRINEEESLTGLRVGFLENTVTADYIFEVYPINFEIVDVVNYEDAAQKLLSGEIDAFIEDADADPAFSIYEGIRSKKMFPLVYTPISMLTENPELAPFIGVINKYLEAGGLDELNELYNLCEEEYARFELMNSLTDEERAFIAAHSEAGNAVLVGTESDNYPLVFYNEVTASFQGMAIDVLAEITHLSGILFEPANEEHTPWRTLLEQVRTGEIPMIAHLLRTEERSADFIWNTEPYNITNFALISKLEYPDIAVSQVVRRKVGLVEMTVYVDVYNEWFSDNSNTVLFDNYNDALDALESGAIDLLMASEYSVLNQIYYREKPGYKVNISLSTPLESSFGFHKEQTVLCSIINKSLEYIDTEGIVDRWNRQTFQYTKQAATERAYYILAISLLLLVALIVMLFLLLKNKRASKTLEKLVKKRTVDLARQTATITAIYSSIPDIVFSMDTNLRYTSCNYAFETFIGLPAKAVIGKTDKDIIVRDPDVVAYMNKTNREVLSTHNILVVDEEMISTDGKKRLFETVKAPLFLDGELVGLLGIARDVTERKEVEKQAQVASAAKSMFLARMSHEIRTPLNAIIGMSRIVKDNADNEKKVKDSVVQILSSSHHLLSILNDVLDMSKIESGKLELSKSPFRFKEVRDDIAGIIRQRCDEKSITFFSNMDMVGDYCVIGDKLRFNQVIINLLGNAVKFTEPNGRIELLADILNEDALTVTIRFSVLDNGIGMKPEQIERLFMPFEQGDNTISTRFGGTGLGLTISQNLVQMMGGKIEVESTPGVFTNFFFTLTLVKGNIQNEEEEQPFVMPDLSKNRMLLVEDIEINRVIVREILSPTGIAIDEAANGQQAVQMFLTNPPGTYDIIYMDVQMPVMDGYLATKALRGLERPDAKTIPIIAMTANAFKEDIEEALSCGMNGHLSKPIELEVLVKNLLQFINKK